MGVMAAFTVENIYDNKRNDIYYWENLNSSNYDKQDSEKDWMEFLCKRLIGDSKYEDYGDFILFGNNGNNYTGYYAA